MTQFAGSEKSSDQIGDGAEAELEVGITGAIHPLFATIFITFPSGIIAVLDCEKTMNETIKQQASSRIFFIFFIFNY